MDSLPGIPPFDKAGERIGVRGRTVDGSLASSDRADHPLMRGRSSDRSARSRSVHRSTGRPVGSPQRLVTAQSLVENVRLAALCGLLRCEIAEDPKGNRRRRSMRRMPRELASGSSEKRRPVSTGVCIPGSGPAADNDDRPTDRPSQCIMRTILRTTSSAHPRCFRLVKGQQDLNAGGHENCTTAAIGTERWRSPNPPSRGHKDWTTQPPRPSAPFFMPDWTADGPGASYNQFAFCEVGG